MSSSVSAMESPRVVSRDEWLGARMRLLAQEKESSRMLDAIAAQRRGLPMVAVDKDYVFTGPAGPARLVDLFDGRRQLIAYHFMWMPEADEGCRACSFAVDNVGDLSHLHASDTTLALVSRAPFTSIEQFRQRMGWQLPWYSSYVSDFNYDFHVTSDESVSPVEYNYKDKATLQREGLGHYAATGQDGSGLSVFLRDGDRVFHTYSTYGRGAEVMLSTYHYLDLTPLGRQRYIDEFPHRDRYRDTASLAH
jgi:predicted dithiol-disulfide oxidoreductase (DUF899 family)